jgi:RimJ/RimL family protein N-acetyltransferase
MTAAQALPAETPRLRLRVLRESDQAFYCSLYADAGTMRYIGPPLDAERAARRFRAALSALRRRSPRLITFVMIERATLVPVGIGSLRFCAVQQRRAEAGIILQTAARARGYAREALAALVAQVFAACPVDRIRALHSVDHSAAGRTIASVGFVAGATEGGSGRPAMQVWTLDRAAHESTAIATSNGQQTA